MPISSDPAAHADLRWASRKYISLISFPPGPGHEPRQRSPGGRKGATGAAHRPSRCCPGAETSDRAEPCIMPYSLYPRRKHQRLFRLLILVRPGAPARLPAPSAPAPPAPKRRTPSNACISVSAPPTPRTTRSSRRHCAAERYTAAITGAPAGSGLWAACGFRRWASDTT